MRGGNQSFACVWECTPGNFIWRYTMDEYLYVFEGEATIIETGQKPKTIMAGDLVLFRAGTIAEWHVTKKVRKLAFLCRSHSLAGELIQKIKRRLNRLRRSDEWQFSWSAFLAYSVSAFSAF